MGLLPSFNIGDIDIPGTVAAFLATLRSIDTKLDTLIELQREDVRIGTAERLARIGGNRVDADRRLAEVGTPLSRLVEAPTADTPADGADDWAGFGTPCDKPLGIRGKCAKSLGHSGRCKP